MPRSLAVDLHAENHYCVIIDLEKGAVEHNEFGVDEHSLQAFERQLRPDDRIAIEATTNAYYFYERWRPLVAEVVIANPVKLRPMLANEDKTDRNDAFWLALLNLVGALPVVYVPDSQTREDRALLHHRNNLVKEQTRYQNAVRALLRSHCLVNPAEDLRTVAARDVVVRQLARLPGSVQVILSSLLRQLDAVSASLDAIDSSIVLRAHQRPETALLTTMPGIELNLSLTMLAAIGDISRFPTPGSLVKYAGLVPKEKASGGKSRRTGLRKMGSRSLRWAATVAAQSAVKQPGPFKNMYRRLIRKGKGVAIAACARKLLTIVWQILTRGEEYREQPAGLRERKERRIQRKVEKARKNKPQRRATLKTLLQHAGQLKELSGARHGFPLSLRPLPATFARRPSTG